MRCTVVKEIIIEDCTETQARQNPWDFAADEKEVEQTDWEVTSVKEAS